MPTEAPRRRRTAFLAALATAVAMLGASFWGLAGVESDLRADPGAQPPALVATEGPARGSDCPRRRESQV